MKKNLLKTFAITLALGVFALSGCSNPSGTSQSGNGKPNIPTTPIKPSIQRETFTDGVHQYTYEETSHILAENGKTNYKIVIERNAPQEILLAVEELQTLFLEATGANLSVTYTDSVGYSENAEFIVLGQNDMFKAAGLSTKGLELGMNGYVIKTKGKSIFIAGDDVYGTLFGTYQFLEMEYAFDCFAMDCYTITPKQKTTLKNFDVIDIPDIQTRSIGNLLLESSIASKRI